MKYSGSTQPVSTRRLAIAIDAQLRWLFRRRRVREAVSRGCQASRPLAAFIVNLLYIPSPEPESRLAVRGRWEQGIEGWSIISLLTSLRGRECRASDPAHPFSPRDALREI